MEKSVSDQSREIKELVRRANNSPDKNGSLRRDVLQRLIDLTHSQHWSLKTIAASSIPSFFNDFPDLEEEAINAIYDICEDQSDQVRIQGYNAITEVSKVESKWVKRNADVLLQLLQSDEPNEVVVVKRALQEHLDLDPGVTLGVLCDQIVPPEDAMEEEDLSLRDRLRSLVLSFLTGEAKRAIVERLALPGTDAESVLIGGLLNSIPKLGSTDIELIVRDLLFSLPSFKSPSTRGEELLVVLLEKAKRAWHAETEQGQLKETWFYLELSSSVVKEGVAPPLELLRFYTPLLHRLASSRLSRLSPDDLALIMKHLTKAFTLSDPPSEYSKLPERKQILDASPVLFERLQSQHSKMTQPSQETASAACQVLLECCLRRKNEGWAVPQHTQSALRSLGTSLEKTGQEHYQEVLVLIRSLAPPLPPPQQVANATAAPGNAASQPSRRASNNNGRPPSLPQRPDAPPPRRIMSVAAKSRDFDSPSTSVSSIPPRPSTSSATSDKRSFSQDDLSRPSKRVKKGGGDEDSNYTPSLLSRMGSHSASETVRKPAAHQGSPAADMDKTPVFGFSIKGAAAKSTSSAAESHPTRPRPVTHTSSSLLDRLQGGGSSGSNSAKGERTPNNGRGRNDRRGRGR